MGALAALTIGASGLVGLIVRPQRAGSATHTGAAAIATLVTVGIVGNPDNYGGQAGWFDPAFAVLALPPFAAALSASPWRLWRPDALRRPRLLALAAIALPGVWYGVGQALMQRNTWPPLADPHHQAHWLVMALLAFMMVSVVAGAGLSGRGWRMATITAAAAALAVGTASLLSSPSAQPCVRMGSCRPRVGRGRPRITWAESKRSQLSP